jgi:hypothetical protein
VFCRFQKLLRRVLKVPGFSEVFSVVDFYGFMIDVSFLLWKFKYCLVLSNLV